MLLTNRTDVSRLGIFFFFDKDGAVDDYIPYMLSEIRPFLKEIFVVCNGNLNEEGRRRFEQLGCKILVRKNEGLDVWAYKEALEAYGWEQLGRYDELILFNYTVFGPIYPFRELFDSMDKKDVDFWGISLYHAVETHNFRKMGLERIPTHLQSHFIAVRNPMIRSDAFHDYWDNMRPIRTYDESVGYHEAVFTQKFADQGFRWAAYADTSDMQGATFYPLIMMPVEMVRDFRCPIIKRKSFFQNIRYYLDETCNENAVELFDFIRDHTDYDIDLIWQNLLRTCNQYDIKNCLNLNYVLPTRTEMAVRNPEKARRVALVMHIYYEDLIDYCYHYASSMPADTDIYVTTVSEEKKEKILSVFRQIPCRKLEVLVVENKGRDVSALLIGCKDILPQYDLICYAHDKSVRHIFPQSKGKSFSYSCYEGVLASPAYVHNVIETFMENPRLGLLTSPPPNHADYYPTIGDEWTRNFDNCVSLAGRLGLNVDMQRDKPPIAPLGSIFWFRPAALRPLLSYGWTYDDFCDEPLPTDGTVSHAIERIHPFVVQHSGYYPAWVFPDTYARIYITNLYYYLRTINAALFQYGFHPHSELLDDIQLGNYMIENVFHRLPSRKMRIVWAVRLLMPVRLYNRLRAIKHRLFRK